MGADVQVRQGVAQGPALPTAFGQPIVLGPQDIHVVQSPARAFQTSPDKRGHGLDGHRRGPPVGEPGPRLKRTPPGQHAIEDIGSQAAKGVL